MVPQQDFKAVIAVSPQVRKDDAAWTATAIDTKGYEYCTILFQIGATDIAMAGLSVTHSDTDGSYTALTGAVFGTSTDIAGNTSSLPGSDQSDTIVRVDIDCKTAKRYLKVSATAGNGSAGTYLSAVGLLSRANSVPVTASQMGCAQVLRV